MVGLPFRRPLLGAGVAFFDQHGGVPESSKDVGRTTASINETVARHPPDEHGEQAFEDRLGGHMNDIGNWSDAEGPRRSAAGRSTAWAWVAGTAVTALAALFWVGFSYREGGQTAAATVPPAQVTVSNPLVRDVDTRIGLLGQFSAIDRVELRAQVGGTLTEIHFQDGQIVHKGDHLFVMRSRLYPARMRSISSSRHFSWQLNRGGCSTYRTGIPVQTIQATSVVHHQGAIEMARAELRYGHNEQLRRLAQEIIVTQQQEIAAMRLAVGQPLPPSVPSPDQLSRTERIDAKSGFEHSPPGKEP